MTPLTHLCDLKQSGIEAQVAEGDLMAEHKRFGQMIAANRPLPRAAFAKKLGITGAMLALMETGKRRWPMARAELAVKLLTRREDWPD